MVVIVLEFAGKETNWSEVRKWECMSFQETIFVLLKKEMSRVISKQAGPEQKQTCPFCTASLPIPALLLLNLNDLTRLICTLLRFKNSSSKLIKLRSKVAY